MSYMTTVRKKDLISVSDFLAGELSSDVKHEYAAGDAHAIVGGTVVHGMISTNVWRSPGYQLQDSPCRELLPN